MSITEGSFAFTCRYFQPPEDTCFCICDFIIDWDLFRHNNLCPAISTHSLLYHDCRQNITEVNIFRYQTFANFPICVDIPSLACKPHITSPTHSCCQNHFWYHGSRQEIFQLKVFSYQTFAIFPFCVDFPSLAYNHTYCKPSPPFKLILIPRELTTFSETRLHPKCLIYPCSPFHSVVWAILSLCGML